MPAPARLIVNLDVPDLARAEAFYCRALGLRVGRRIGAGAVELLGLEAPLYLLEQADGSVASDASPARRDYRRHWTPVHFDIAVDDLDTARAAVQEEALRDDVLAAPEMLGVDELGADSVTLRLTVTVRANTQWTVERELRRRIRAAFAEHGIRAPYPTGLPVSALQKLSPESPAE